jgi:hypothetical protein
MRGKRRRQVRLLAVAVVLAFGFWACLPWLDVPRDINRRFEDYSSAEFYKRPFEVKGSAEFYKRPFEVNGSAEFYKRPSEVKGSQEFSERPFGVFRSPEFYNLLLDSSVANCSGGQPFKVK